MDEPENKVTKEEFHYFLLDLLMKTRTEYEEKSRMPVRYSEDDWYDYGILEGKMEILEQIIEKINFQVHVDEIVEVTLVPSLEPPPTPQSSAMMHEG